MHSMLFFVLLFLKLPLFLKIFFSVFFCFQFIISDQSILSVDFGGAVFFKDFFGNIFSQVVSRFKTKCLLLTSSFFQKICLFILL